MAYGFPYQQPPVPGYFNINYSVSQMQIPQIQQPLPTITSVPDELTARNAQFPMDGSPVYFINANGQEIYFKQLSMANGSVLFHKFVQTRQQIQISSLHFHLYYMLSWRKCQEKNCPVSK